MHVCDLQHMADTHILAVLLQAFDRVIGFRRSTVSGSMTPAVLSDVPEEDSSCTNRSWYCDPAYSISSLASRRARKAAARTSRRSSGSGDGMSSMPGAETASYNSMCSGALPQPLSAYIYQALPCKMPQTDRLARWRCAPDSLPGIHRHARTGSQH